MKQLYRPKGMASTRMEPSLGSPLIAVFLSSLLCMACFTTAAPWSPPSKDAAAFPYPPTSPAEQGNATLEYMDPSLPPLLPDQIPKCSVVVLQHAFANAVGSPPTTAEYDPPADCPAPWSRVILDLSASASDVQEDRIAAVWIEGVEILRTSTPRPMAPGVFWHVRKDVTRYTALLRESATFSMMLENTDTSLPGVYSVNVSLHYYRGALCGGYNTMEMEDVPQPELKTFTQETAIKEVDSLSCNRLTAQPAIKGLYPEPADLIVPLSSEDSDCGSGCWFKIEKESDVHLSNIVVPKNSFRAVLEIYVSHHGDDEEWYMNPLRTDSPRAVGDPKSDAKPNGGFRQVVVAVDKRFVGAVVPFPVIHPGSVNPFLWAPVASIGAYDHPSYDLDLTPFMGLLLDGKEHLLGVTIEGSQSYWLVSANLHLWLDQWSDGVEGALVEYRAPPIRLSRQADWREQDGKSSISGQGIIRFAGWVSTSKGNITTSVRYRLKFKSRVEVHMQGTITQVAVEVKSRTNLRTDNRGAVERVQVSLEAPLQMEIIRSNGGGGTVFEKTKLLHQLEEATTVVASKAVRLRTVSDKQESEGSVLKQDGVAMWGSGDTKSTYNFRDDKACYVRAVNMMGGRVVDDVQTASCAPAVDM